MYSTTLAVTIPTWNRPEELHRCLIALETARRQVDFLVYVRDSSDTEKTCAEVRAVCTKFDFVRYFFHAGKNTTAAVDFCAKIAEADIIVNVDEGVCVEPDAIKQLADTYNMKHGTRVLAGSAVGDGGQSQPLTIAVFSRMRYS